MAYKRHRDKSYRYSQPRLGGLPLLLQLLFIAVEQASGFQEVRSASPSQNTNVESDSYRPIVSAGDDPPRHRRRASSSTVRSSSTVPLEKAESERGAMAYPRTYFESGGDSTERLHDLLAAQSAPLSATTAEEAASIPDGNDYLSALRAVSPATAEEASIPVRMDDLFAARRARLQATTIEAVASTPDGLHDLSAARATLSATREGAPGTPNAAEAATTIPDVSNEAGIPEAVAHTPGVSDAAATARVASTHGGTTAATATAEEAAINIPKETHATAATTRAKRRHLECSEGDDFRLSSTVYASADGCYSETGSDTDAYVNAEGDRIVFPASISASSSGTEVFAWVAGEMLSYASDGSPIFNPACVSDEVWEVNSHPADVESWSCLIGGALVSFSEESFGAHCGCSSEPSSSSSATVAESTPAPAASSETSTPSSTTTDSSPLGEIECDEDSITITFPHLEEFGGCFLNAGGGGNNTTGFFSQMVEHVGGVEAVFPAFFDERGDDVRWVAGAVADSSSDSRIVPVCLSDNSASASHPAESTWLCDFTSTGAYMTVSEDNFQVDCGCNNSTSSPETPTPSLGESETPTPSLGGSGSRDVIPTTSPPAAGEDFAGNDGRPTPSPSFPPFVVDRLGTSGGAPRAPETFSVLALVGFCIMVGFVRQLVGR